MKNVGNKVACFQELSDSELITLDAGGIGGFICGTLFGGVTAIIGGCVMAFSGASEKDTQAFVYSAITTGAAIGSVFTGPV